MTRQAIYDRLRAIGVTVESADAVAEALEPLPDKKVEAFLLWLIGYSLDDIGLKIGGCTKQNVSLIITKVNTHLTNALSRVQ